MAVSVGAPGFVELAKSLWETRDLLGYGSQREHRRFFIEISVFLCSQTSFGHNCIVHFACYRDIDPTVDVAPSYGKVHLPQQFGSFFI
jgi:hypothetical protein